MSDYMDTPHYRVNQFVSALRVCDPKADVISHLAGAFPLRLADLEAVVREWADQREIIDGLRVENDDYAKANAALGASLTKGTAHE